MKTAIRPIRNDADLKEAIERTNALWGSAAGTPKGDELDVLMVLIDDYESKHYPMSPVDPIDYMKIRMNELGLKQKDLAEAIGNSSIVSQVFNRQRGFTIEQIRTLATLLKVPAAALLGPSPEEAWTYLEHMVRKHVKGKAKKAIEGLKALATSPQLFFYRDGDDKIRLLGTCSRQSKLGGTELVDYDFAADSPSGATIIANAFDVWAYSLKNRKASTRVEMI